MVSPVEIHFSPSICRVDKFQGLIQMKDATTAQTAKLVRTPEHVFYVLIALDAFTSEEFERAEHLQWLLYIAN
jgi:hypothetical protein